MSWVANVMVSVHPDDRPNVEALSEWLRTEAPLRGDPPRQGCGFLRETNGELRQYAPVKPDEDDLDFYPTDR
ncbi:hypothetical protein [Nonomuraea dietziae]|uniref:hypothetical protein n=1 Tax=Nonomuraea dietziae TaxID=65515 RepID=UPI0033E74F6C